MYVHVYIYIYTHIHIHTYMCVNICISDARPDEAISLAVAGMLLSACRSLSEAPNGPHLGFRGFGV